MSVICLIGTFCTLYVTDIICTVQLVSNQQLDQCLVFVVLDCIIFMYLEQGYQKFLHTFYHCTFTVHLSHLCVPQMI